MSSCQILCLYNISRNSFVLSFSSQSFSSRSFSSRPFSSQQRSASICRQYIYFGSCKADPPPAVTHNESVATTEPYHASDTSAVTAQIPGQSTSRSLQRAQPSRPRQYNEILGGKPSPPGEPSRSTTAMHRRPPVKVTPPEKPQSIWKPNAASDLPPAATHNESVAARVDKIEQKISAAAPIEPVAADVNANQKTRPSDGVRKGLDHQSLFVLPEYCWMLIKSHLSHEDRASMQRVSKDAFWTSQSRIVRVGTSGAYSYQPVMEQVESGNLQVVGKQRVPVTEEIMQKQPQWLVEVYDRELQVLTISPIKQFEVDKQKAHLQTQLCKLIQHLHNLPCKTRVKEISFVQVACLNKRLLFGTDLLSEFTNLKILGIRDCSDIPLEQLCEHNIQKSPWRVQYTGTIPGLSEKSQKGANRASMGLITISIRREAQRSHTSLILLSDYLSTLSTSQAF